MVASLGAVSLLLQERRFQSPKDGARADGGMKLRISGFEDGKG